MACVKPVLPAVLPLFVVAACALTACETTADRRDLYSEDKPQGPYYTMLHSKGGMIAQATPTPAPEGGPIAPMLPPPPPPPPADTGTPDTEIGAPAATPVPDAITPIPTTTAPPTVTAPSTSSAPAATPAAAAGAGGTSGGGLIPGLSQ